MMKSILNPKLPNAQHAIAYFFVALTILTLLLFIFETSNILERIGTASVDSQRLFDDWYALKADLLAAELAPSLLPPERLIADRAACDRGIETVSGIPLLSAMRKLDGEPRSERDLEADWGRLRRAWAPEGLIDSAEGGPPRVLAPLGERLALATAFESSLGDRIALIKGFEQNQRSALTILQASSVLAIAALIAIGLWSTRAAGRSQRDQARLRELIRATFAGQEAERARIALDLHDSVAQDIASSLMAARRLEETPSGDRAALVATLKGSLDELRRMSWEIRPPELERLSFQGAAMRLFEDFETRNGFPVELRVGDWKLGGLGLEAELHLYRILQEALTNASKHAKARRLVVELKREAGLFILSVSDDGVGFDALERSAGGPDHMGLAGMRERVRLVGGSLRILSSPGRGTTVEVEVPYAN